MSSQGAQREGVSYEYIRGLFDGEGCFTFHVGSMKKDGRKYKIPAVVISMNIRDKRLLELVREKLKLKSRIYYRKERSNIQNVESGKIYRSDRTAILMVRDFKQLKDVAIPLFYKKLAGYKGKQFIDWIKKIGSDPDVSDRYKSLYRLYKWGAYDKHPNFVGKYIDGA